MQVSSTFRTAAIKRGRLVLAFRYDEFIIARIKKLGIDNYRHSEITRNWSLKITLSALKLAFDYQFAFSASDEEAVRLIMAQLLKREKKRQQRFALANAVTAPVIPSLAAIMRVPATAYQWVAVHYALLSEGRFLLADDMGLGKALTVSEPVLTPDGWVKIGDIKIDDFVIGKNGKPIRVTGVYPQKSRDVFTLTCTDKSSVKCSPDHLWEVRTSNDFNRGTKRILSTQQLLDNGLRDGAKNLKYRIPLVDAVVFAKKDLPIDPYTLGALLGDGSIDSEGFVKLSTDLEICQKINGHSNARIERGCARFGIPGIAASIRKLNLAGTKSDTKFVPAEYLLGSIEQRKALLAGLLDTNGWCSNDTTAFCSTSKQIIDAIIYLVRSLGGVALLNAVKHPKYTYLGEKKVGKDAYSITVRTDFNPFTLTRKADLWKPHTKYKPTRLIESIERTKDENCVCIRVDADDHLFVTKDFIVTHNTLEVLMISMVEEFRYKPSLFITPVPHRFSKDLFKFFGLNSINIDKHFLGLMPQVKHYTCTDYNLRFLFTEVTKTDKHGKDYIEQVPKDWTKHFNVFIDEAHRMKNRGTQRRAYAVKLMHQADVRIPMTGTPVMNRPEEVYDILSLIDPQFMSWFRFATEFCGAKRTDNGIKNVGKIQLGKLNRWLYENLMLRREKEMIEDQLPPKVRDLVELHPKPIPVLGDTIFSRFSESAKIKAKDPAFIAWLTDVLTSGKKVGLFGYHMVMLDLIESICKKENLGYFRIDGSVSREDRAIYEARFHNDPDCVVALLSIGAGGVGLDLQAAHICIMAELYWVPGIVLQAEDRFHRKGLKHSLQVINCPVTDFEYALSKKLLDKMVYVKRIMSIDHVPDEISDETLLRELSDELKLPIGVKSRR